MNPVLALVACAAAAAGVPVGPVDAGTRREAVFRASCDGSMQPYVELVPNGFEPARGALVALHGHGADRTQFADHPRGECKAAREAAQARGLLFVSPDYRGKTSWMGPKAEADVLDLLAHLTRTYGVTNFYFCGGSMGGTSALTFAARHPSLVKGVVALNPLADHLAYTNFQDAISASFGGDKVTARDEYFRRSAVNYPERFTMPVSITTGGADTIVPPESVRRLAREIAFRRPDLVYYDEVPARRHETDHAASKKAFDEMFRRAAAAFVGTGVCTLGACTTNACAAAPATRSGAVRDLPPYLQEDFDAVCRRAKAANKILLVSLGREACGRCQKFYGFVRCGEVPVDPAKCLFVRLDVDNLEHRSYFFATFEPEDRHLPYVGVMNGDREALKPVLSGGHTPAEYAALMK